RPLAHHRAPPSTAPPYPTPFRARRLQDLSRYAGPRAALSTRRLLTGMDYFPIFLNLNARRALVVGGGETAFEKAMRLRDAGAARSEDHTSELQSLTNLVCRLLLE